MIEHEKLMAVVSRRLLQCDDGRVWVGIRYDDVTGVISAAEWDSGAGARPLWIEIANLARTRTFETTLQPGTNGTVSIPSSRRATILFETVVQTDVVGETEIQHKFNCRWRYPA